MDDIPEYTDEEFKEAGENQVVAGDPPPPTKHHDSGHLAGERVSRVSPLVFVTHRFTAAERRGFSRAMDTSRDACPHWGKRRLISHTGWRRTLCQLWSHSYVTFVFLALL